MLGIRNTYETVTWYDPRREEFSDAVSQVAQKILKEAVANASTSKKAQIVTDAFLKANFTKEQIQILQASGDPIVREASKHYRIEKIIRENFPPEKVGCCRLIMMKEGEILFFYTSGLGVARTPASVSLPQLYGSVS